MGIEHSARSIGDLVEWMQRLQDQLTDLQTARRLPASTIEIGSLRIIGGNITVDENGEIIVTGGRIVSGDPVGVRAEITNVGYRLINEDGQVDIDLTTEGSTNQIRLRGTGNNEDQSTEILLTNKGEINGKVLNVSEINLDGQDLSEILSALADAATGDSNPDPSPTPSGDLTIRYDAEWSQCYRGSGSHNDFASGLNQGWYSSTNNNQRSLIGFDSSQIQSDHSGRTVTRVRVFLYFKHWYYNSGGTAILGHHGHSSVPGSFSATTDQVRSGSWPKGAGRWVTYDVGMQGWVTGSKTGIALGPGPTNSRLYYGTARRHNQNKGPILEIRSTP